MMMRVWLLASVAVLALLAASCSPVWRGVDARTGEHLIVEPTGTMPAGESFTGQYVSAQLGQLDLKQSGEVVTGHFERLRPPDDDCRVVGTLQGTADGDLLKFTWSEDHTDCGDSAAAGEGYIILRVEPDGAVWLFAERGLDCDRDGKDKGQAGRVAQPTALSVPLPALAREAPSPPLN